MAMSIDELRRLRLAHPFHPFEVHLRDGRRFRIERPDALAISPQGDEVLVAEPSGKWHVLKFEQLSEVSGLRRG
jgi:hypothetical protein